MEKPKAKRKRKEGGLSERTLRRRKAEGVNDLPPSNDPSSSSDSDSDNTVCDDYVDSIYRLFEEGKGISSEPGPGVDQPYNSGSEPVEVNESSRDSISEPIQGSQSDCLAARVIPDPGLLADFEEGFDTVFCGSLFFDCDSCVDCSCIVCDVCSHSETGECVHCDRCRSHHGDDGDGDVDGDVSSEDGGEVLSPGDVRNKKIKEEFKGIVHDYLIKQTVVNDLLSFFRKWSFGDFPKTAKTLLDTPGTTPTRPVRTGEYWHAGITSPLIDYVQKTKCESVNVNVSVDGVPLAGSSNSSFWPILCSFNDSPDVILAGAYHGYYKPEDSNVYLLDFNAEMTQLCEEGFTVDGKKVCVSFHCLHCDAPAKAFVLKIKNFNGYFSCPKCTQEGEMTGRRMCFLEVDAPLRSDESFRAHQQQEHHVGKTDAQDIPTFGPVSTVPYDYMHLALLGVMSKLMYMWLQGPFSVRLEGQLAAMMSDQLVLMSSWKPREFVRKLRQLQFIKRFKATEFRQILFYSGPVVFEQVLPKKLYEHFIVLHVAMTLLAHPIFSNTHVDYAEELLKFWVLSFKSLYGGAYVSHNIHGLVHLSADVRKFGPLDNFSAFKFENFLQFLIKLVRKGDKPLQQLARRYTELASHTRREKEAPVAGTFLAAHGDGPLLAGCGNPQFRKFQMMGNIQLDSSSEANNCCVMDDGSVVIVKNFAYFNNSKEMVVIGRRFLLISDLYSYPLPSSTLGIHYVRELSSLRLWPTKCVSNKVYRMPFKAGFAVVPLLHAERKY